MIRSYPVEPLWELFTHPVPRKTIQSKWPSPIISDGHLQCETQPLAMEGCCEVSVVLPASCSELLKLSSMHGGNAGWDCSLAVQFRLHHKLELSFQGHRVPPVVIYQWFFLKQEIDLEVTVIFIFMTWNCNRIITALSLYNCFLSF